MNSLELTQINRFKQSEHGCYSGNLTKPPDFSLFHYLPRMYNLFGEKIRGRQSLLSGNHLLNEAPYSFVWQALCVSQITKVVFCSNKYKYIHSHTNEHI